jgi:hypothetical protein
LADTQDNIPLTSLLLDAENPRLELQESQRDVLLAIASTQTEKLLRLARDIVEYGLNPSERTIVTPTADDKKRYVVLEGNRRVAALKVLSTPDLIASAVKPEILRRFKKLSERFLKDPIDNLDCAVVKNREEADHWITLKHTGENQGAGIVSWGATESGRYAERRGKILPQLQVLDFVKQHGKLSAEAQRRINDVSITNLQRLIGDPDVRKRLGIEIKNRHVVTRYNDQEAAKGLSKIVEDLALERINVNKIRHKKDRAKYINSFAKKDLPEQLKEGTDLRQLGAKAAPSTGTQPGQPKRRSRPGTGMRTAMIPRNCILEITDNRINNIYIELKQLSVDHYPNAGAVLLRVFLELSLDAYITQENLQVHQDAKLSHKLTSTANHLKAKNKMTDQELQPVRRAAGGQTLLASSIPTLHGYVHNRHFSPSPLDLKTAWDDLQKFLETIWS